MTDKTSQPTTASPQQAACPQNSWNNYNHMYMYNQMYNNMYAANFNHPYYQFFMGTRMPAYNQMQMQNPMMAQQQTMMQQQMQQMEQYRNNFISGGQLSTAYPQQQAVAPQANATTDTSTKDGGKIDEIDLPPLPPGPPPPAQQPPPPPPPPTVTPPPPSNNLQQHTPQHNMYTGNTPLSGKVKRDKEKEGGTRWSSPHVQSPNRFILQQQQQQQHHMQQQQQQQPQPRFKKQQQQSQQQNLGGGPIRFNMTGPRARLNYNKPLLPTPDWMKTKQQQQQQQQQQQHMQLQHQQQQHLQMQHQHLNQDADRSINMEEDSMEEKNLDYSNSISTTPSEQRIRQQVDGWPEPLKEYVNNCYNKCETPGDKDKVSAILKNKIIRATQDGTLWTKRWNIEPLPILDSEITSTPSKVKNRLGPIPDRNRSRSKSPGSKKKRRERRRSDSSSSSSSRDSFIGFSSSKNKKNNRGKKNKQKNNKKYIHDPEKSHYWSEYGMIQNGGEVETKKEVLDKRAARFNTEGVGNGGGKPREQTIQRSRLGQQSYQQQQLSSQQPLFFMDTDAEFDLSSCHIVGTSQDIEKPYLRLTAAPEACQVRPPEVLIESLSNAKQKWVDTQDYRYVCEQLKSIRQDLTVQGIRDQLTVQVYETHARIALEKGDHAEFNQCQSQLSGLHRELNSPNRHEFTAYRILYFIFTQEFMDVNTMMYTLSREEKKDECIAHALLVTKAWLMSNHYRIFKLYEIAPRMSSYLIDWFLPRERRNALKILIKSYRPSLPTDALRTKLAIESESKLNEFLEGFGLVYTDEERTIIDCKASTSVLANI